MNKDVIYIEPEDDITDIIAKLKASAEKVVAIVPPKKIGALGSSINIKLIGRTAKSLNKAAVIVTDSPSLMKLCREVSLPVAANLKSRPAIPSEEAIEAAESGRDASTIEEPAEPTPEDAEIAEDFAKQPESAAEIFEPEDSDAEATDDPIDSQNLEDELAAKNAETIELSDADDESDEDAKPESKSAAKSAKNHVKDSGSDAPAKAPKFENAKKLRKWLLLGGIVGILLVVGLVWAFGFAPKATISLRVGTTPNNFSESASFTTNPNEEDAAAGRFYLETIERKESFTAPLSATGEQNVGDKAKGELVISYTFRSSTSTTITVPAGSSFTQGGHKYTNEEKLTLVAPSTCTIADLQGGKCIASAKLAVIAVEPGEQSNCDKNMSWSSPVNGISITNSSPISGGNTKIIKIVQQSDIDQAVSEMKKLNESEAKELLGESLKDGSLLIDSSYKATLGEPSSSLEPGAEFKDGATVSVEVSYSIYAIDSARVEEFIRAKANIGGDQKIYDLGAPYVERFTIMSDGSITGKVKTVYRAGPEITSDLVMNKVRGKKVGEASSLLKSINGVADVKIETSFFWVNSIPDDPNKITINIEVEK